MKIKKTTDPLVKKYLDDVSENLVCDSVRKKFILSELEKQLADFVLDNPGCSLEDIRTEFGYPELIQKDSELKAEYIRRDRQARKKAGIMTAVIILLSLAVIAAIILLCHFIIEFGGTFNVSDVY